MDSKVSNNKYSYIDKHVGTENNLYKKPNGDNILYDGEVVNENIRYGIASGSYLNIDINDIVYPKSVRNQITPDSKLPTDFLDFYIEFDRTYDNNNNQLVNFNKQEIPELSGSGKSTYKRKYYFLGSYLNDLENEINNLKFNSNISLEWSNIENTPTTVLGYGITDVYTSNQIDSTLSDYILESSKNIANGVAGLNSNTKIPISLLPDSIINQLNYKGSWDASTNTPTLPLPSESIGDYYIVSVSGTYNSIVYNPKDFIISNGTSWEKIDNTDSVISVFGRNGIITAQESDYESFYPKLSSTYDNPTWINTLDWIKIYNTPTTISGYGIIPQESDYESFYPKLSSTYNNPTWINTLDWIKIYNTPTTISGYGITDVYTQSEINNNFLRIFNQNDSNEILIERERIDTSNNNKLEWTGYKFNFLGNKPTINSEIISTQNWTSNNYVPYTGATSNVNLNNNYISNLSNVYTERLSIDTSIDVQPSVAGEITWNDTCKCLHVGLEGGNVSLNIGNDRVLYVRNTEGTQLVDGDVVYFDSVTGNISNVKKASNNTFTIARKTIAVVTETINNNEFGYVLLVGTVSNLDTSSYSEGDLLYLSSTAGEYTTSEPSDSEFFVYIGYVKRSHSTQGQIYVKIEPPKTSKYIIQNTILSEIGNEINLNQNEINNKINDNFIYLYSNMSAGRMYGAEEIVDNGDGTVTVREGGGIIKNDTANISDIPLSIQDGQSSGITYVTFSEKILTPVNNAYNYIYYNNSTGELDITTDFYSISITKDFTVGRIYIEDGRLITRLCGTNIWNFNRRLQLFGEEVYPIKRASGLIIGNPTGLKISSTSGILYAEIVNRFSVNQINTNVSDTYTLWYQDGSGGFNKTTGLTDINNTQWDDGSGTLSTLTANRFTVSWWYITHNSELHCVLGRGDYKEAEALNSGGLSDIPGLLSSYSTRIGRTIVQKNSTTVFNIESEFTNTFTSSGVISHQSLNDINGSTDAYHVSNIVYNNTHGTDVQLAELKTTGSPTFNSLSITNNLYTDLISGYSVSIISFNSNQINNISKIFTSINQKTTHPTNYKALYQDTDTGEYYASDVSGGSSTSICSKESVPIGVLNNDLFDLHSTGETIGVWMLTECDVEISTSKIIISQGATGTFICSIYDDTGARIGYTDTGGDMSISGVSIATFSTPITLTANNRYYIGISIDANGSQVVGYDETSGNWNNNRIRWSEPSKNPSSISTINYASTVPWFSIS